MKTIEQIESMISAAKDKNLIMGGSVNEHSLDLEIWPERGRPRTKAGCEEIMREEATVREIELAFSEGRNVIDEGCDGQGSFYAKWMTTDAPNPDDAGLE